MNTGNAAKLGYHALLFVNKEPSQTTSRDLVIYRIAFVSKKIVENEDCLSYAGLRATINRILWIELRAAKEAKP